MSAPEITEIGLKLGYLIFMAVISYKAYQIFKKKELDRQQKKQEEKQE